MCEYLMITYLTVCKGWIKPVMVIFPPYSIEEPLNALLSFYWHRIIPTCINFLPEDAIILNPCVSESKAVYNDVIAICQKYPCCNRFINGYIKKTLAS